jgi:glycerol-3-phosphate acyltransferase PlsY
MIFLLLLLVAFLIGSIPTGILISKSKGIDLRKIGSGNIGATNVLRAMGKEAALLTLLGDITKGILAIFIAKLSLKIGMISNSIFQIEQSNFNEQLFEGLIGIAAILGHNFSLFLKFKGGKGVATSLGVLLIYSPYVALFTITIWLLVVKWSRYSSLGALVAFGILPFSFYIIDNSKEKIIVSIMISFLIFIKHRDNIKRLFQGIEPKIGNLNKKS